MFGWVTSWFTGMLQYIAPSFFGKTGTVIFIGLDEAGKTTLMYRLKEGKMTQALPTYQPSCEPLEIGNVSFKAYDMGGHLQVRRVWRDYFMATDAVIFIVDGSNITRFDEAKKELHAVLNDELLADIPIAVLMNKIDKPSCIGESEFIYQFDLVDKLTGKEETLAGAENKRPMEVFPISILQCQGYGQVFTWLGKHMK